jgi:glutathione S-transferase
MGPGDVVLHQFQGSHYNEKVRWALDWKGVAHVRASYLPGPHVVPIRRLSGQTATPVLLLDRQVVAGSAGILEALERRFPARPLLPADPALRQRALAIQRHFDEEVGPAARTAIFSVLLDEPDYLCRIFARGKPALVRSGYRASLPLVRPLVARANGVTGAAQVERAFERTRQALDFVAKEVGASGQLVGDAFTLADLAGAALLAILTDPPHPDMAFPKPVPERVAAFHARWASHPTTRWVLEQYARHRPPSCALSP